MRTFLNLLYSVIVGLALFVTGICAGEAAIDYVTYGHVAPAVETTEAYPMVYYRELKHLGNGVYLCEVWAHNNMNTTIMKLTASEKAKLQRAYAK
jgi:hypothetical protein